jgi:hypothetical protein
MIIESTTIQLLQVIFLALKPTERWRAARHPFNASSAAEGWLTVFAMVALIIAVILMIWLTAKRRRSEDIIKRKIAELTTTNIKLQQEIDKLGQQKQAEVSEQMPSEELEESEEPVAIQKS